MIIADECLDNRIIAALQNNGFVVYPVYIHSPGLHDAAISQISVDENKIIITQDKDFGKLQFKGGTKHFGVILLRYHFTEIEAVTQLLVNFLNNNSAALANYFTVITPQKIRTRILPQL